MTNVHDLLAGLKAKIQTLTDTITGRQTALGDLRKQRAAIDSQIAEHEAAIPGHEADLTKLEAHAIQLGEIIETHVPKAPVEATAEAEPVTTEPTATDTGDPATSEAPAATEETATDTGDTATSEATAATEETTTDTGDAATSEAPAASEETTTDTGDAATSEAAAAADPTGSSDSDTPTKSD